MSVYKMPDLSKFPDCYALTERGKCTWLRSSVCRGEQCTIKRTHKEYNDSVKYVFKRILTLDNSRQSKIAQKYYGGAMPWRDNSVAEVK